MKKLILFTLLLYSFHCFSQSREIEELIDEASNIIVPTDFQYYNLVDTSFVLDIKRLADYNPILKRFKEENPDFNLSEFLFPSNGLDKICWCDYNLTNAILYSYEIIPKFATHSTIVQIVPYKIQKLELDSLNRTKKYNEVIVPVKSWWSKKRIAREVKKKWDERSENTILEDKKYFMISTPIFSLNRRYAMLEFIIGGEEGKTYVFERIDGRWVPLSSIDGYVY